MKKILPLLLVCLALCGCAGETPNDGGAVRLHIVAHSDSLADQAIKLQVRDMLLQRYGAQLAQAPTGEAAYAALQNLLQQIRRDTDAFLRSRQQPYTCTVQAGVLPFPTRTYDALTFPAGDYRALKVVLGAGEGHNWWCVLYPPLCLVQEDTDAYLAQLRQYSEGGAVPTAAVRSLLADRLLGSTTWDKLYARWMQLLQKEGA